MHADTQIRQLLPAQSLKSHSGNTHRAARCQLDGDRRLEQQRKRLRSGVFDSLTGAVPERTADDELDSRVRRGYVIGGYLGGITQTNGGSRSLQLPRSLGRRCCRTLLPGGLLCGAAVRGQRVAYEQQRRHKRQGEQQTHSAYVCFQYEILDDMLSKRDRLQKTPAQIRLH